jgi:phosphoribosylformimino-5-aminoimidazole carboxamide ribotide isomerase
MGVTRIILGTAAVEDEQLLRTLVQANPDRIAVAIDAQDGIVRTRGWKTSTILASLDWIRHLAQIGVRTVIYTDIAKDGMLQGPNFDIYQTLRQTTSMDIIASGGIATLADVRALKAIGIAGAIIGKAYYEGTIDLKEAILC